MSTQFEPDILILPSQGDSRIIPFPLTVEGALALKSLITSEGEKLK